MLNCSNLLALALGLGCMAWSGAAQAANVKGENKISGEYLEIRSCSVYTGPCFANAEMGVTGKLVESMIFTSPPRVTFVGFMRLVLKSNRCGTAPVPWAGRTCVKRRS